MAGSYSHVTTNHGNLVSEEAFPGMIENLGDAFEMAEEMYGMIWFLAHQSVAAHVAPEQLQSLAFVRESIKDVVEAARQNYPVGLRVAKEANRAATGS
jgi:hypothetical protein